MAITPSYSHDVNVKQLKIGSDVYWLKDADLREVVESFGSAVYKNVVTTFDESGVDLATEAATAAYIKEKIKDLEGVIHFKGLVTKEEGQTYRQAIDAFYTAKGEVPAKGDLVIFQADGKEFICVAVASPSTVAGATWEEIGDQNLYLTKAEAATTYVPLTRTIAGIDLQDNVTVAELSDASALNLKALSHKDSASGSVEVLDSINNISVGKADTYSVANQSTVDVPATYNVLDVTPAGTIDVSAGTAAAATYQKTSSVGISASTPTGEQVANYTPSGSVSLPSLTASVSLSGTDVATVTSAGTAYSLSESSVTKAADSTSKFVKKGVSFVADSTDQSLTLAYVENTDAVFYSDAVTAAGAVSYVAPTLSGALPTFGSQNVALTTGATASAAYSGDASFTGAGALLSTSVNYATENANVTQPTFTAEFTGTAKSVTPSAATTVSAAAVGGDVTVAAQDTAITPVKKTVTVTVS